MPYQGSHRNPTRCSKWCHVALLLATAGALVAQTPRNRPSSPGTEPVERTLEPKRLVNLSPGDRFAISIPLRVSTAVNLGTAELDITLASDLKRKEAEEELHLIGHLATAQVSLPKGDQALALHGVVPNFSAARNGMYHASDYSIHVGSGSVTNIGTPDNEFIDTEALAQKLQGLRLRLMATD